MSRSIAKTDGVSPVAAVTGGASGLDSRCASTSPAKNSALTPVVRDDNNGKGTEEWTRPRWVRLDKTVQNAVRPGHDAGRRNGV